MNLLEAKNLTKKYKDRVAVDHINLQVVKGQLIALLGPNGAGKSTTINMLIGLLSPTLGTISIANKSPQDFDYKRNIGVVFQHSIMDDTLTVMQNLKYRVNMYEGCTFSSTDPLLEKLGIHSFLNQRFETLSGGQKRRVEIARALLHKPDILFLDEPSTGLDIQTRTSIWGLLNELRNERELTIILTTHYLEEAEVADFIYIIDHGKIIESNTISNLKDKYAPSVLTIDSNNLQQIQRYVDTNWSISISANQLILKMTNEAEVIPFLNQVKPWINHFQFRQGTIDDIFMKLTGREIR